MDKFHWSSWLIKPGISIFPRFHKGVHSLELYMDVVPDGLWPGIEAETRKNHSSSVYLAESIFLKIVHQKSLSHLSSVSPYLQTMALDS